jgi:predicted nucleic acid-binding protein
VVQAAREGRFVLLLSDLMAAEVEAGPPVLQGVLKDLPEGSSERVAISEESERLRDAYLLAKVVGPAHAKDAHHIALATVARADLVVSWNFKHIVHWDKIRGFNAVNLLQGYAAIEIRSPQEVI